MNKANSFIQSLFNNQAVSLSLSKAIPVMFLLIATNCFAQKAKPIKPPPPVTVTNNKLAYTPDSLGNRIPDFSYCGYRASEQKIPNVEIKCVVPIVKGDATARIQAAIDVVANIPMDKNGFRGAILLQKGIYEVYGQLKITTSGVVLRGSGTTKDEGRVAAHFI